jgi:hypothetical protein
MIDNRVPGYYIFFQGEEKGGIGSSWLALNDSALVGQFKRAITFDRKGTHSIITHQMCGRTCSDEFAYALSDALNDACTDFMFVPDDTGVYTDTAEFADIIPECTNISAGYYSEHTPSEKLDLWHLKDLAEAVLKVKWDSLEAVRDPSAPDPDELKTTTSYSSWPTYNKDAYGYSNYGSNKYDYEYDYDYGRDPVGPTTYTEEATALVDCLSDAKFGLKTELLEMVANFIHPEQPDTAMKFLNRNALTEDVILDAEDMLRVGYEEHQVIEYLFDMLYKE